LTLDYNGNQLKNVSDAVDQSTVVTSNEFVDKGKSTDAEYLYDANGNQTADLNRITTSNNSGNNIINLLNER